jgi:type VI secretion system secreted protein Hcp
MIVLKFDKQIKGACQEEGHKDWINVSSIQLGVGRSITTSGSGTDRDTSNPSFSEITFSRETDVASQELFLQACGGVSLGKAEIHFIQTAGKKNQVYLEFELKDPIITGYSLSSGGERPSETFSVNFTEVKQTYHAFSGEQVVKGKPKGWDLNKNKAI